MNGKKLFKSVLKAVITAAALTMDYGFVADDIAMFGYEAPETMFGTLSKLFYAIETPTIATCLLIGSLILFDIRLSDMKPLSKSESACVWALALLAAFSAVIGKLFYVYNDIWLLVRGTVQLLKGLIVLGGLFWLFSGLLRIMVLVHKSICGRCGSNWRLTWIFDRKYSFAVIAILLFMAWLPTIIAYYPAVFMGDSEDIIYMAYNYPSGIETTVLPLKEGCNITNHHPVIYTGYVSLILHAVRALGGSYNFGIFCCALIQCLLTLCVLAYSCMYCANGLGRKNLAFAAVCFYALFPLFPKYAVMISKDTFFADLLLLWAIFIHKAASTDKVKKDIAALMITSAAVVLIRKNGVYVIVLTLALAAVLYRSAWKRWIMTLGVVVAVSGLYSGIVLPAAGIPDGSVREMLSVPFQQTARYVKYHADEVTQEERLAIAGVLDYDRLGENYAGSLSDPVKATYNKAATGDALKAYFAAWLQMLAKHPEEYAAAFLNNYYGYVYPVVNDTGKLARTSVGSMANVNRDGYFDFSHCNDKFHEGLRDLLTFYDLLWMRLPAVNLLMTSALYVWAVLLALLLVCIKRDKAAVLAIVMYLVLIATVLVGPSNAINYERYVFPCILGMPFLAVLTFRKDRQDVTPERSIKNV